MTEAHAEEREPSELTGSVGRKAKKRALVTRYWGEVVVVALAFILWAPRLSGPIDLRYDGGVYYVLGTSLSEGHGYRIPSEPSAIQALQYPPLLPAIVALHQRILGTADPNLVAPWLRGTYFITYLGYALAVFALARRYLGAGFALVASGLCLFHFETFFLSDLLFAEIPFALISVLFVLVATTDRLNSHRGLREVMSFLLAAAGFLLRTAGIALLGAWVLESVVRRQWRLVLLRGVLSLLPVLMWQAYVARVQRSDQYAHPAYQYQRAPYQYYNVSYAENMRLVDPFHPELGSLSSSTAVKRLLANLPALGLSLGEGISARGADLAHIFLKAQRRLWHQSHIPPVIAFMPVLLLSALVVAGLFILATEGGWLIVFIVLLSTALVLTTPWPEQFTRYLVPIGSFLSIVAVLSLLRIGEAARNQSRARYKTARLSIVALLLVSFGIEAIPSTRLFRLRRLRESLTIEPEGRTPSRLFSHDVFWQNWERAGNWLQVHAPGESIVATSAPHWLYLRTGLRAVLPPMESDPARARRLLQSVPVSYVIVDELGFLDISRRYAAPAMESDPIGWRLVQSWDKTRLYERVR